MSNNDNQKALPKLPPKSSATTSSNRNASSSTARNTTTTTNTTKASSSSSSQIEEVVSLEEENKGEANPNNKGLPQPPSASRPQLPPKNNILVPEAVSASVSASVLALASSSNNDDPDDYDSEFKILCSKEQLINELLAKINSEIWGFQKQMDIKSRQHLKNLLLDMWSKHKNSGAPNNKKKPLGKKKRKTREQVDKMLRKQLAASVHKCFEEMMYEYGKWCAVARRKNRIASTTEEKATAMLLLLTVFTEIDLVRAQNHTCQLLFHLAYKCHLHLKKNAAVGAPFTRVDKAAKKGKKDDANSTENPEKPLFVRQPISSIAQAVVREAKYCYEMAKVFFNKNVLNQEFFDWDDLNDLCWTPGFVQTFFKRKTKESIYSIGGFESAFRMRQWPHLNQVLLFNVENGTSGQMPKLLHEQKAQFNTEKTKFTQRWKTYTDRAGGWLGIKGYITFFLNFYPPIYYQLLCMAIAFGWLFNFKFYTNDEELGLVLNYIALGVTGAPLVLAGLYFVWSLLFHFWIKPSIWHPYRFSIPRRDTLNSKPQRLFAWCDFVNIIPNHIMKLFHRHHIYSMIAIAGLTATYIVIMRWVIFQSVDSITTRVLKIANGLIDGTLNPTNQQMSNIVITFIGYGLLWVSILFVCSIMPPILFSVWAGIFGFIKGWWVGANRIKTWKQMVAHIEKDALLQNFKKKLLAESSNIKNDQERDVVEAKWAFVWNSIIDDFYENHQCSRSEKNRLSYKLAPVTEQEMETHDFKWKVVDMPDLDLRPTCSDMAYHLIRFINNMYQNMPCDNVRVMDMKRLCIVTPVYREKIFYSWEELVETSKTSQSFLRCLITKYPHDWRNFKDKEFQEDTRLKKTIEYIEDKVMSGSNINRISSSSKITVTPHLIKLIQSWASQRFQPVSRTIKGFMKLPKSLSLLLKLQNPELSDEQLRTIVRQKFCYMIGAQLYDETVWKAATGYERLPNDTMKRENEIEYKDYVEGLNYLGRTVGDNMLRIAYVKQVKVMKENSNEFEKKYRGVLTVHEDGVPVHLYDVEAFGDFSQVGQGKPANQGFIAQFFDASYIQAVDCNMDSTLSQSLFVPNVLKEFDRDKRVKIIGFPEFIFTSTWSQFGYAAAFTERVFGSMIQRVWAMIGLRMHYGHPDFLRGLFVMFTTGMSKLSYISEDVFLGFDTILNKGKSIQVDYFEVGKARDVDTVTTTKFNRKIAMGAAQLACSRYPHTMLTSRHLTFSDKLLFCYSVLSHYSNTLFTILAIFILYTIRLVIMILITIIMSYVKVPQTDNMFLQLDITSGSISLVADSMFLFQMGMALSIPGIFFMISEKGLTGGLRKYIEKLAILLIYSMFQLLNIGVSFHTGFKESAKYIASGRGTGLQHRTGREVYSIFKSTHFYPAGFMLFLVAVGIITGGSPYYLVFHGAMILIWILSPTIALPQLPSFASAIAPWRSGYKNELNALSFEEMIENGSVMSTQRVHWFNNKKDKFQAILVDRSGSSNTQLPSQVYQPLDMPAIEKMNKSLERMLKVENKKMLETFIRKATNIFVLEDSTSMEEAYKDCKLLLDQLYENTSGIDIPKLASLCSDYLLLNKESNQHQMMREFKKGDMGNTRVKHALLAALAQYDLYPQYCKLATITKKATAKVEDILKRDDTWNGTNRHLRSAISECTHELIEAACSFILDNHREFHKLMFIHDKSVREVRLKTQLLLSEIIASSSSIAKRYLIQAQKGYHEFAGEVQRRRVFLWPNMPEDRRLIILLTLQNSLNFAKRLTESRTSHDHNQVTYFSSGVNSGSQILTCDAFDGDNGSAIFDQMLMPIHCLISDELLFCNLSDAKRKEIKSATKHMLVTMSEQMRNALLDESFLETEATCQDMFELMEAGQHVLKKYVPDDNAKLLSSSLSSLSLDNDASSSRA